MSENIRRCHFIRLVLSQTLQDNERPIRRVPLIRAIFRCRYGRAIFRCR